MPEYKLIDLESSYQKSLLESLKRSLSKYNRAQRNALKERLLEINEFNKFKTEIQNLTIRSFHGQGTRWTPSLKGFFGLAPGSTLRKIILEIKEIITKEDKINIDLEDIEIKLDENHLELSSQCFDLEYKDEECTINDKLSSSLSYAIKYAYSIFDTKESFMMKSISFSQLENVVDFLSKHLETELFKNIADRYNNFINDYVNYYLNQFDFNDDENSHYYESYKNLIRFYLKTDKDSDILDFIAQNEKYPFFRKVGDEYQIQSFKDGYYVNFSCQYQTLIQRLSDEIILIEDEDPYLFIRYSYKLALKLVNYMLKDETNRKKWEDSSRHFGAQLLHDIYQINPLIYSQYNKISKSSDYQSLNPTSINPCALSTYYFPKPLLKQDCLITYETDQMLEDWESIIPEEERNSPIDFDRQSFNGYIKEPITESLIRQSIG